jgi:hypothetical protein
MEVKIGLRYRHQAWHPAVQPMMLQQHITLPTTDAAKLSTESHHPPDICSGDMHKHCHQCSVAQLSPVGSESGISEKHFVADAVKMMHKTSTKHAGNQMPFEENHKPVDIRTMHASASTIQMVLDRQQQLPGCWVATSSLQECGGSEESL